LERGVKFNVEDGGNATSGGEQDYPPGEKQRLHRRDTPHHLKNKRVNQQVDKEKVATIIAEALKKRGDEGETSSSTSVDGRQTKNGNHNLGHDTSGDSNASYGEWCGEECVI